MPTTSDDSILTLTIEPHTATSAARAIRANTIDAGGDADGTLTVAILSEQQDDI